MWLSLHVHLVGKNCLNYYVLPTLFHDVSNFRQHENFLRHPLWRFLSVFTLHKNLDSNVATTTMPFFYEYRCRPSLEPKPNMATTPGCHSALNRQVARAEGFSKTKRKPKHPIPRYLRSRLCASDQHKSVNCLNNKTCSSPNINLRENGSKHGRAWHPCRQSGSWGNNQKQANIFRSQNLDRTEHY